MESQTIEEKLFEFVYDVFIKKYGLRHVAEKKYVQLLNSVRKYNNLSFKISLFARFLGISDESKNYDDINFKVLGDDLLFTL